LDTAAQWDLNGSDSAYSVGVAALNLQNFDRYQGGIYDDTYILHGAESGLLIGNAGNDTFRMNDGATLLGTINGGGGMNLLDYSNYKTSVSIDLIEGMATGISSLNSIQNIYGGSANDTLYGNNGENVIKGNGGNDILSGIDGDDTYLFTDGFGVDQITESTGMDTLDFSEVSTTLTFSLASSNVINDVFNRVTYNGNLMERLIGGSADDIFYFADGFALPEFDGSMARMDLTG
jgi:Ca2+-binding RTX toxin-like protein